MITIPIRNPRVLVRDPSPQVATLIHSLTQQGATVTVEADRADASLRDLESRGLVTLGAGLDGADFDIVFRDPGCRPHAAATEGAGRVTLVGGGPGPEGLLTRAGFDAVTVADVIVCDRLAPLGALASARPDAEVVHVGKIPRGEFTPQETINRLLVDRAAAGAHVVRLKGGDGFVFGRGGEEWNACMDNGIAVEVIPGVSSSVAVPALAGIPLTHRGMTQGFVVVSGHVPPTDPRSAVDWASLARSGLTIVVLMGIATATAMAGELMSAGLPSSTPAAAVANGGLPSMQIVVTELAGLAESIERAGIEPPAILVIGPVVRALTPTTGDQS